MADQPRDDEPASSKRRAMLCSDGQREAQAYATAELREPVRPTVEMDRVQVHDPRMRPTLPGLGRAAPPAAAPAQPQAKKEAILGAVTAPLPDGLASQEAPTSGRVALPPAPPTSPVSEHVEMPKSSAPEDDTLQPSDAPIRTEPPPRGSRSRVLLACAAVVVAAALGVRFRHHGAPHAAPPARTNANAPAGPVALVQDPEPQADAVHPTAPPAAAPPAGVDAPPASTAHASAPTMRTTHPSTPGQVGAPPPPPPAPTSNRLFGLEE